MKIKIPFASLPREMKFDEVNLLRGRRIVNYRKPPFGIWAVALRFGWSALQMPDEDTHSLRFAK